jgi:hypothetical protein
MPSPAGPGTPNSDGRGRTPILIPILGWAAMGWALGLGTAAETSFVNPMGQLDFH